MTPDWRGIVAGLSIVALSGCMVPGYQYLNPPGFSSTWYQTHVYPGPVPQARVSMDSGGPGYGPSTSVGMQTSVGAMN